MKLEAEKAKPQRKWRSGVEYVCTLSKSVGYKKGNVYKSYTNDDKQICLKGEDGFEDLCVMLVSSFEEVK